MSDFLDSLHDVFSGLGPVQIRPMFGGYGVFHDGVMFALVADDEVYLKSDAKAARRHEAEGLEPFRYEKGGRSVIMSYHRAPEAIFDDPELATERAKDAFAIALRARKRP
ncbi:MAG: TfoX/Sxy family protein [Gammaproteobacteria bacterium]|nr:TfoX/Sxy family protein [Gammaproteobacteria bacterium]